ncbi:MAG: hypothetical protein OQK75_07825 [Gammaproteobacteria bacterium]|nr:hypothetical protein [Gammaproteobacteria bacterium]MCW8987564.1 hypothetical protein [Gammaproteobacteria bacterium]
MTAQFITSELLKEDPGLIDLVDKFLLRLPILRDDIVKAHSAKEWENFSRLIHQLKGVGGGYGYLMLTQVCADIEVSLRNKDFNTVKNQIGEMNNMSEMILAGKDENHKIAEQVKS